MLAVTFNALTPDEKRRAKGVLLVEWRALVEKVYSGKITEVHVKGSAMIFIVVKFKVKPDWSDRWLDLTREFTEATRNEPGNLWFDWSRSVENPHEFVLVEAFTDDAAGDHVNSDHFTKAMQDMPQALVDTPEIISEKVSADGWGRMGELTVD